MQGLDVYTACRFQTLCPIVSKVSTVWLNGSFAPGVGFMGFVALEALG